MQSMLMTCQFLFRAGTLLDWSCWSQPSAVVAKKSTRTGIPNNGPGLRRHGTTWHDLSSTSVTKETNFVTGISGAFQARIVAS